MSNYIVSQLIHELKRVESSAVDTLLASISFYIQKLPKPVNVVECICEYMNCLVSDKPNELCSKKCQDAFIQVLKDASVTHHPITDRIQEPPGTEWTSQLLECRNDFARAKLLMRRAISQINYIERMFVLNDIHEGCYLNAIEYYFENKLTERNIYLYPSSECIRLLLIAARDFTAGYNIIATAKKKTQFCIDKVLMTLQNKIMSKPFITQLGCPTELFQSIQCCCNTLKLDIVDTFKSNYLEKAFIGGSKNYGIRALNTMSREPVTDFQLQHLDDDAQQDVILKELPILSSVNKNVQYWVCTGCLIPVGTISKHNKDLSRMTQSLYNYCCLTLTYLCPVCSLKLFCCEDCYKVSQHKIICSLSTSFTQTKKNQIVNNEVQELCIASFLLGESVYQNMLELSGLHVLDTVFASQSSHLQTLSYIMIDILLNTRLIYLNLKTCFLQTVEYRLILEMFLRIMSNVFKVTTTIWDDSSQPIGLALYQNASLFNHSCHPSAIVSFCGKRILVNSTGYIPKSSEVTISYGPTVALYSYKERQHILFDTFGFHCSCNVCIIAKKTCNNSNSDIKTIEESPLSLNQAGYCSTDYFYEWIFWRRCLDCDTIAEKILLDTQKNHKPCFLRSPVLRLFPGSMDCINIRRLLVEQKQLWDYRKKMLDSRTTNNNFSEELCVCGRSVLTCRDVSGHTVLNHSCCKCGNKQTKMNQSLGNDLLVKDWLKQHIISLRAIGIRGKEVEECELEFAKNWWNISLRHGHISLALANITLKNVTMLRQLLPTSHLTLYRSILCLELLMKLSPDGLFQFEHLYFVSEVLMEGIDNFLAHPVNNFSIFCDFVQFNQHFYQTIIRMFDKNHALVMIAKSLMNKYSFFFHSFVNKNACAG